MADKVRYQCNSCKFRFARKPDVEFKHCPNCGKSGTCVKVADSEAQKILDDVTKMRHLYDD